MEELDQKAEAQVMTAEEAYIHNMSQMNTIIRQMKVIPELPSEVPKETNALQRVEFPDEGGILTYIEGFELPYKGFPYFDFVDKIDVMKKVLRGILSGSYHQLKSRNKLLLLTLIPSIWALKPAVRTLVYTFHRMYERFKIKPDKHCQAIRELYKAFSVDIEGESKGDKELRTQLRDLTCMIAEFDNAYRYRLQDIVVEVNKENLKNRPIRELVRLLEVMQAREKTQEIKDTWTLLKYLFMCYMRFDRSFLRIFKSVLLNINLEEIELKADDKQFARPRKDYEFGFKQLETKDNNNVVLLRQGQES